VFEYFNKNPVFGVIQPDNPLWAPILGFFAITGLPTAVSTVFLFSWFLLNDSQCDISSHFMQTLIKLRSYMNSWHPSIDFHTVKLAKLNSNSVTYVCTGVFVVQGHQVSEPSFWGGWQSRRIRPVKGSVIFVLFLNVLALLIPISDLYNSSNVMLSPSIIAESDYIPFKCFVNAFHVIILCLKWYFWILIMLSISCGRQGAFRSSDAHFT
jgi:hypothetical protein